MRALICWFRGGCMKTHVLPIGYVRDGWTLYQCQRCKRVHFQG